ncbi:MAG: STAS domain-containing protein [Pirellulales bacterium]|nr:STAS domain-containing protein [Pirellulales bacterium]
MSTIERHGAVTVLRIEGPLRADTIESVDQQLRPQLSGGVPYVLLDLSATPLIDGAGLEWMLMMDDTCCRRGGCLRICNAGELCQDILRITAVGELVQQFDDLTIALGSFA